MTDSQATVLSALIQSIALIIGVLLTALTAYLITGRLDRQKHSLERDQAFRQLFVEFNEKFNELNKRLNEVVKLSGEIDIAQVEAAFEELNPEHKEAIYDYLNLCAEEYFWCFKRDEQIIDPIVWNAWETGMKDYFFNASLIKHYFKTQAAYPISYYGFYELKWLKEALESKD